CALLTSAAQPTGPPSRSRGALPRSSRVSDKPPRPLDLEPPRALAGTTAARPKRPAPAARGHQTDPPLTHHDNQAHHRHADAHHPAEVVPSHWRTGGPISLAGDTRFQAPRGAPPV